MAKLLDSRAAKRWRWEEDERLEQEFLDDQYPNDGGKIGWTQHRHVVAMSVAARVAVEMGTVMEYMPKGMLIREIRTEPDLAGYAPVIFDESHEHTLSPDIFLGSVKDIAHLRLLISSVTMNAAKFPEDSNDALIWLNTK
ncbi:hypothetical protein O181_098146 [Austropuccinia psidii MF-1]|uniref:Helicase ATP-binding domain-containing protein n=1 Tax=Austropuccinia psidii MF-1 TaxID=1389203 RepID=A0A9Q3JAB6_9BASI|nr:hypothetical protein [Austropuccinia psidii MF-1]